MTAGGIGPGRCLGPRTGRLESQWTIVDGLRMHARVSVDPVPETPLPVVLVHGLGVSSRYMVPAAEHLAPYYRAYAPDLPGFGKSAKPRRILDVAGLADALAAWMDAVGLERAMLLGNSLGCQIIAEFALRQPGRVERAIFVGPTADPHARATLPHVVRLLRDVPREPRILIPLQAYDYAIAGVRRSARTFKFMLQHRMEEVLPRLEAPTLVVRGAGDPIVPQRWAEEAARLLPLGRLVVIPGQAHCAHYGAPLELARVVRPFVDGDPGGEQSGQGA